MEQWERELHVARIIAAKTSFRIDGMSLYVIGPTRVNRYIANEIYRSSRRDAELEGALSDDELLMILMMHKIWTIEDQEKRDKLDKALDDLKVGLFENRLRSNAKSSIRQALRKTKEEIVRLDNVRHGLDFITVDGLALSSKFRYLIASCLYYENGLPYWQSGGWDISDPFTDKVLDILAYDRLTEAQYRELVRNEPWRSIWGSKANVGRGTFDCAAVDLTDEQRGLILWSTIYDNVREYPDCPGEDVFNDDDMMDGWLIQTRRKRESQQATQQANSIGNAKIRESDEIFILADTIDDAREIEKMNDAGAAMTKAQRMSFLKKKGEVNEANMPDTAQRIQMDLARLESMKIRQGK